MRIELTHSATLPSGHDRRLLLIFAGWGMDAAHFSTLTAPGYDIMVAFDYSDGADIPSATIAALAAYSEIVVAGWSFGVPVANRFISLYDELLPITLTLAVNGTPWPVDDSRGIPTAIFKGTLNTLSDRTLEKFRRRMTGSSASLARFMEREPQRSLDSLRQELIAIEALPAPAPARWDLAVVSADDRIIPAAAQQQAWTEAEATEVISIEGAHYPDLQSIIDRHIKNKKLVECRFSRSRSTYDDVATVQRDVAAHLATLTAEAGGIEGRRILEVGCGTGLLTRTLLANGTPSSLELWDLVHSPSLPADAKFCVCDAETAIAKVPDGSLDTIVTASTVQWFNSLPKFLRNARRAVSPGGMLVMSTFGPDTFADIARITGSSVRRPSAGQLATMARRCGWTVETAESDLHTLTFDTVLQMLRHLQQSGVNGVSAGSMADVIALSRQYPRNEQGRISLVYQPIYLLLRYGQEK